MFCTTMLEPKRSPKPKNCSVRGGGGGGLSCRATTTAMSCSCFGQEKCSQACAKFSSSSISRQGSQDLRSHDLKGLYGSTRPVEAVARRFKELVLKIVSIVILMGVFGYFNSYFDRCYNG